MDCVITDIEVTLSWWWWKSDANNEITVILALEISQNHFENVRGIFLPGSPHQKYILPIFHRMKKMYKQTILRWAMCGSQPPLRLMDLTLSILTLTIPLGKTIYIFINQKHHPPQLCDPNNGLWTEGFWAGFHPRPRQRNNLPLYRLPQISCHGGQVGPAD